MSKVAMLWSRLGDLAGLVATPLAPSHYLALVSPLAASHALQARVEAVHAETAETRTLVLRPGRGWRGHRAGQHVRIGVPIDGRIATRTYSISSSPDRRDGCFAITVKAQGRASRVLARETAPGAYLALGLAAGSFVIPDGAPVQPLFVTAGSGITPVMSMLRTFAGRGALPDTVHVHFAPTPDDVIFDEELRALAAAHPQYRLAIIHTRSDPRRLDGGLLAALAPDWRSRQAWACGPQRLLEAVEVHLPHAQVERFAAAIAPLPATALGGAVRFAASGVTARAEGRTPLLRIAEQAGLAPPHGCRMGICHTCDATMVSGCVRDLRTGQSIDEPGARIQICVCAAAGDVELTL